MDNSQLNFKMVSQSEIILLQEKSLDLAMVKESLS
jgi:hypothetical protein